MNFAKELESYNKPPSLYDGLPIQKISTEDLIPLIRRQLMQQAYEPNPEKYAEGSEKRAQVESLNSRIKKAWLKDTGTFFEYSPPTTIFSHGSPGHGKTTSFYVAAKQLAKELDLIFLDKESIHQVDKVDHRHMVYDSYPLAGEISMQTLGGLPSVEQDEAGRRFMSKLVTRQNQLAHDAAFALTVYDDLKNAIKSIQDGVMEITETGSFQNTKVAGAVGCTGNIGIDGTNVAQSSTAAMTRTQNFLVYDTVGNYVNRVLTGQQNSGYTGRDIGADAVTSFLMKEPHLFTEDVRRSGRSRSVDGTYANPRTWSKCINEIRPLCNAYLQQKELAQGSFDSPVVQSYLKRAASELELEPSSENLKAIYETQKATAEKHLQNNPISKRVQHHVQSIIGMGDAGRSFHEYLYRRLSYGTDMLAREIMENGQLSQVSNDQFINQYQGHNIEAKDFGHHMVMSMAEAAALPLANAIRDDDTAEVQKVAQRFAKGMLAPADIKVDGKAYNVALEAGEVNRGVYFLLSKATHKLNNPEKLKVSSTGYMMDSKYLQSFLTGVAQEPTSAQVVDPTSKRTRYDGIADLLTNKKEANNIQVLDLEERLAKAREESAVTATEASQIAAADVASKTPGPSQQKPAVAQTAENNEPVQNAPDAENANDAPAANQPEPAQEKPAESLPEATDDFELGGELEPEPEQVNKAPAKQEEQKPIPEFEEDDDLDFDEEDAFEPPAAGMGR